VWGYIFDDEGKPPVFYFREISAKGISPLYGIVRLSDDPQKPHIQTGDAKYMNPGFETEYIKIDGDPEGLTDDPYTFEIRANNPETLYRFSSRHTRVIEGSVLDLTYDHFPYAMKVTGNGWSAPYYFQPARIHGTYNGNKVDFLGGWDRQFINPEGTGVGFEGKLFGGMVAAAIRKDGRCECCSTTMVGDQAGAFYYLEGEPPVISNVVTVDPVWEPLAYDNDGTYLLRKAVFQIANKRLHYEANWGCRGFMDVSPPGSLAGFSQSGGIWWEGDTPREYEKFFVYCESHGALMDNIKKYGRWEKPSSK